MDEKALYKLSYGLFVVTAREGSKDNGCVTNTVMQVTTTPNRISLAVNKSNADTTDRSVPGYIGNGDSYRCCDHSHDLGGIVGVNCKDGHYNGNVVSHILGEKRTDRTVDHTGSEYSLFGGLALSLHKGAGNSSYGIKSLLIVNGEGEEVNALSWLNAGCNICHYYGLAVFYPTGAVGKLAGLACFNGQLSACISGLENSVILEHNLPP